jgi:transcriptional regulator with GAF, ATPase, and Fis domain
MATYRANTPHRRALTGANVSKPGKFEQADHDTVFLDEIGDVPPQIQVKLLRVPQEREFERLGSNKTLHIDVRVVAATNQDLRAALERGTFREISPGWRNIS